MGSGARRTYADIISKGSASLSESFSFPVLTSHFLAVGERSREFVVLVNSSRPVGGELGESRSAASTRVLPLEMELEASSVTHQLQGERC